MRLTILALASGLLPLALAHPLEKRENALPPVNSAVDESVLQLVWCRVSVVDPVAPLTSYLLGSLPRAPGTVSLFRWL